MDDGVFCVGIYGEVVVGVLGSVMLLSQSEGGKRMGSFWTVSQSPIGLAAGILVVVACLTTLHS
jgi:hypothetical protein